MMRKRLRSIICLLLIVVMLPGYNENFISKAAVRNYNEADSSGRYGSSSYKCYFKTDEKYFTVYDGKNYNKMYLNGVNIGSGKPGYYPGELAVTYKEYLTWFKQIAKMGANTIRVYTVMKPCFYHALYQYNKSYSSKLYLFQGVWYDEDKIAQTQDAYDILDGAVSDIKDLINIIHGKATVKKSPGKAYGTYKYDVSKYVIGWILGIESDADFVSTTNANHADITGYKGNYLYTEEGATPFESFLCKLGDKTITYEMNKYKMQRPVSWSNWPTADTLTHSNEPLAAREDAVSIDTEKIQGNGNFQAGLFASYHIYPYYPEFITSQSEYASYIDDDGKINPYKAYLEDLIKTHTRPVLVAEFGVPSSRGCTHANKITGYNQGNITEEQQGDMLSSMASDIYESGYCGGLAFAWQDEWFKRTWNTMDYTDSDRRAYWSDIQTCEQNFGLLAFDSGKKKTAAVVDGNTSEWRKSNIISGNNKITISAKKDTRYLYLMIKAAGMNFNSDKLTVPVDVTPESGSKKYGDYSFNAAADFVININGKKNSSVLAQSYYDRYAFNYRDIDTNFDDSGYDNKSTSIFHPIYLCLNRALYFPETQEYTQYEKYETGRLTYGNANPASASYNSLADFCFGKNSVEMRIPWSLLNFRDPSTKEVEADFHKTGTLSGINVNYINIGAYTDDATARMSAYTWKNWDYTTYHSRLKQSYYILKKCFTKLKI